MIDKARLSFNGNITDLNFTRTCGGHGTQVYTFNHLIPGTTYEVKLSLGNPVGWSEWSDSAWVTTASKEPDKPLEPTVASINATHFSVVVHHPFDNGSPIDQFRLQECRVCSCCAAAPCLHSHDGDCQPALCVYGRRG